MIGAGVMFGVMMWALGGYRPKKSPAPKLRTYAAIAEGEVLTRLLAAPGSPLYAAIEAVIDEATVELLEAATEEGVPEAKLRHRLGGADALAGLKARLEQKIEEARERELLAEGQGGKEAAA